MKTSMKCLSLVATLAIMSLAANAMADTLANWTFETSKPSTAGPIVAETGSGTGSAAHAGGTVYSSPAGNGSSNSWSSNDWAIGDYYQFEVNASSYENTTISYDQTGSATGPRDFLLEYSADGTNFTVFGSQYSLFSPVVNWSGTANSGTTTNHQGPTTVTALDGAATAYFRIVDNSTTSTNNGTVAAGGTGRVDNVNISATAVPEPATFVLAAIGLGLAGLVSARKYRG